MPPFHIFEIFLSRIVGLAAAAALAAGKYGACLPSGLSPGAAALAAAAAGNPYFTSVIKSGLAAASGPQG